MFVKEKTILVTGAGNGIGRHLVLNLLHKQARVIAVDVNLQYLEETKKLAQKHAERLFIYPLNIADKNSVFQWADDILKHGFTIDGLINNAGVIQPFKKIHELDFNAIDRVMNINFFGTLYMVKAFLPHLLQRPEAHIVNISSMGGFLPVPGQSVYGASKAAVKLLTEGLYSELKNTPVKVSVVFPGAVATNISSNSGVSTPQVKSNNASSYNLLSPEKASEIIIRGMEKNNLYIYAGKDSSFLQKLYRFSPQFATNFIAQKMKGLLNNS